MGSRIAWLFVGAISGIVFFQQCGPEPFVSFPEVIIPVARIIELEPPDRPPTIIERVVYQFPPASTARALGGGTAAIEAFCQPLIAAIKQDTVVITTVEPQLFLRSGTLDQSWWGKDNFSVTGPTNTGDLLRLSYHTRGSFDFRASGDSVIVRYGKFNIFKDYAQLASDTWALYSLAKFIAEAIK